MANFSSTLKFAGFALPLLEFGLHCDFNSPCLGGLTWWCPIQGVLPLFSSDCILGKAVEDGWICLSVQTHHNVFISVHHRISISRFISSLKEQETKISNKTKWLDSVRTLLKVGENSGLASQLDRMDFRANTRR